MDITEEQLKELQDKAARADELARAAEDYKKDLFRFKDEAKARGDELAKMQAAQAEAEKKRMVEQEQYKGLYEKAESEREAAQRERDEALESAQRFIVSRELRAEALKAGVREEALPDLDLLGWDGLDVKRDGNSIRVNGVAEFLTRTKKARPHWFADHKPPVFNDPKKGTPGEGQDYTADQLLALRKKDPAAYIKARREMAAKPGR